MTTCFRMGTLRPQFKDEFMDFLLVNETFGMELIEQIYLKINYQSRLYIKRVFQVFIRTEGVDRLLKSGRVNPDKETLLVED